MNPLIIALIAGAGVVGLYLLGLWLYAQHVAKTMATAEAAQQASEAQQLSDFGELLDHALAGDQAAQNDIARSYNAYLHPKGKLSPATMADRLDRNGDLDQAIRLFSIRAQVEREGAGIREQLRIWKSLHSDDTPPSTSELITVERRLWQSLERVTLPEARAQILAGSGYVPDKERLWGLGQQLFAELLAKFREGPEPLEVIQKMVSGSRSSSHWPRPLELQYPPDWNDLVAEYFPVSTLEIFSVERRELSDEELGILVRRTLDAHDREIGDFASRRTRIKLTLAYVISNVNHRGYVSQAALDRLGDLAINTYSPLEDDELEALMARATRPALTAGAAS